MKIPIGETKIEAGVITFALDYRQEFNEGQGVGIQVIGDVNGTPKDLLRFDCFDFRPHYHYDPDAADPYKKILLDKVTAGNPIGWSTKRIRDRLQPMLTKAGYGDIADRVDMDLVRAKLPELESVAREMALRDKVNVVHDRGDEVIVAGNLKFGLEYRQFAEDQGVSIHVLSDVAGQEIEILAFDCFEKTPHYHYGPRNQDFRFYWDTRRGARHPRMELGPVQTWETPRHGSMGWVSGCGFGDGQRSGYRKGNERGGAEGSCSKGCQS